MTDRETHAPPGDEAALGLACAEARRRLEAGQGNTPVEAPTKTEWQIIRGNIFTFFNLIFVVLAVCLALVNSFHNMLFLIIAAANTLIGIVQEIRAKHTIDKLSLLNAPRATVIRDGKEAVVPVEELVLGDVVLLSSGSQIPADAVVLSGEIQANEALLTGEPDAVVKTDGVELLSGSFVVAGRCRARLTRVGAESYAARLTLEAKKDHKVQKSEMMCSLDKLIKFIGLALVPMGVILFCKQFFALEMPLGQAVTSTVGALIGMIPEGLYLLTSVALAVSVLRLARKKTLVHEMSCIETLARVDVLCVDKTGTITEPGMQVAGLVSLDEIKWPEGTLRGILGSIYAAEVPDNDTARAMTKHFSAGGGWTAERVIPFTSATKWSGVRFAGQGSYVVGAPEFILGAGYEALRPQVESFSAQGERVLLLARHEGPLDGPRLTCPVTPLALVRISNKIRAEAPGTFRYFAQQGVAVKVISGDNPLTVSQVAQRADVKGAEHWVDATTLDTDEALAAAAERYTVFGRVTPNQKRKLVQAMKAAGHTVAMTGDGVNDVLALKDANVGIAMASGADAACQAAQLVLLSSDFSALPEVVLEGRRVINNIQRASALFLVKNIFSFSLALITILLSGMPYPLQPIQLSLIGAFTIGIPSFFLALEPNHALVKGHFLSNVLKKACPGGLTNLFLVLGVELFAYAFGFTNEELSTLACLLIGFNGLIILFQVCKPFDGKRRALWWTMTAGLTVSVLLLGSFFSLVPLTLRTGLVFAVFLLLGHPSQRLVLSTMSRCIRLLRARRKRSASASD